MFWTLLSFYFSSGGLGNGMPGLMHSQHSQGASYHGGMNDRKRMANRGRQDRNYDVKRRRHDSSGVSV